MRISGVAVRQVVSDVGAEDAKNRAACKAAGFQVGCEVTGIVMVTDLTVRRRLSSADMICFSLRALNHVPSILDES